MDCSDRHPARFHQRRQLHSGRGLDQARRDQLASTGSRRRRRSATPTTASRLFQRGKVLWSTAGGTQPVFTNGDNSTIGGLWVKSGATASRYGFPIGPETCSATSCQQRFQYGTIVWSAAGGIQPLFYSNDNSTISAYYTLNLGGIAGKYGFPVSAETCQNNTCVQKFQYGNVYWSAAGGIQPVWTNGSTATIGGYYESLGGPASPLSYPASAAAVQGHHLLPAVPLRLRDLVRGYRAADSEHHEGNRQSLARPGRRRRSTGSSPGPRAMFRHHELHAELREWNDSLDLDGRHLHHEEP